LHIFENLLSYIILVPNIASTSQVRESHLVAIAN